MSLLRRTASKATRAAVALVGAAVLTTLAATPATSAPATVSAAAAGDLAGWEQTDSYLSDSLFGSQGLASFEDGSLIYRGLLSAPKELRDAGWDHVGDPDTAQGHEFDAFENGSQTSKLFGVTTPGGDLYLYEHELTPGEKLNSPFAAVSPDSQWMVSGEWGDQNRLLVFPAPLLNPSTPRTGGSLPLAGQINLDHTIRKIQGCDFISATQLVCASEDPTKELWPVSRPLFQIDLEHALDGNDVNAHVTNLGGLPQTSICSGSGFETEGVDYHAPSKTLRAMVVPPGVCKVFTDVYEYHPTNG